MGKPAKKPELLEEDVQAWKDWFSKNLENASKPGWFGEIKVKIQNGVVWGAQVVRDTRDPKE